MIGGICRRLGLGSCILVTVPLWTVAHSEGRRIILPPRFVARSLAWVPPLGNPLASPADTGLGHTRCFTARQ